MNTYDHDLHFTDEKTDIIAQVNESQVISEPILYYDALSLRARGHLLPCFMLNSFHYCLISSCHLYHHMNNSRLLTNSQVFDIQVTLTERLFTLF